MISKIFNFLKKQEQVQAPESDPYEDLFKKAVTFTAEQKFTLDSHTVSDCEESVSRLITEVSNILVNEIPKYHDYGFDPIVRFGGDCGNIHYAILNFIKSHYPSVSANMTIGEVSVSNQSGFEFDQAKCIEWLENGSPQVLDCHAWITINNDYILDCTIGTYINTRIDSDYEKNKTKNLFGGLIFGNVDNLQRIAFYGLRDKAPQDYLDVKYNPVILGIEAFSALAPRQP